MRYTAGTDLPGLDHLFKYIKIIKAAIFKIFSRFVVSHWPAPSFWRSTNSVFTSITKPPSALKQMGLIPAPAYRPL